VDAEGEGDGEGLVGGGGSCGVFVVSSFFSQGVALDGEAGDAGVGQGVGEDEELAGVEPGPVEGERGEVGASGADCKGEGQGVCEPKEDVPDPEVRGGAEVEVLGVVADDLAAVVDALAAIVVVVVVVDLLPLRARGGGEAAPAAGCETGRGQLDLRGGGGGGVRGGLEGEEGGVRAGREDLAEGEVVVLEDAARGEGGEDCGEVGESGIGGARR
jgi:hypothetical protein